MHKKVDIFLITLSSPIQIGIYKEHKLIDTIISEDKSSDVLPTIFRDLFDKYTIENLFYVNGPGSFMAIKIAYIFLKSISILKNIPLYATDAFKFNENVPIKAVAKLYFVKMSSEIKTQRLEEVPKSCFRLPELLDYNEFSKKSTPLYMIDAVG